MTRALVVLISIAALALGACGSDDGGGGGGGSCSAKAAAINKAVGECPSFQSLKVTLGSEDYCRAVYLAKCDASFDVYYDCVGGMSVCDPANEESWAAEMTTNCDAIPVCDP